MSSVRSSTPGPAWRRPFSSLFVLLLLRQRVGWRGQRPYERILHVPDHARQRKTWLQRLCSTAWWVSLSAPGMLLGIHRGHSKQESGPPTPSCAQPGIGTILSRSAHTGRPGVHAGLSNGFGEEFQRTWGKQRKNFPIDVVFGAPIGFDDLRERRAGCRFTWR